MFTFALALLAAVAIAHPAPLPVDPAALPVSFAELAARQDASTSNELSGPCRAVTFIFARGTSEAGNLGSIIGPQVSAGLKARYGTTNVATQGVDYAASIAGNLLPDGCDDAGIATYKSDITTAATKCPNTKIVVGGYSQGAACTHYAVRELDATTRNRIVGAVTFGDTKNEQDGGQIPNYPPSRTKIFCAAGDLICDGTLIVSAAHLSYGTDAGAAVSFLASKIGTI